MIENLKALIDALGGVGELAGWLVGAFILYQVILYLSTTGAIVFILKLAIERAHDIATRPKVVPEQVTRFKIGSLVFLEEYEAPLIWTISLVTTRKNRRSRNSTNELRNDDIAWLSAAIREKLDREEEEETPK